MSPKLTTCYNITGGPLRLQNTFTLYKKKHLAVWQTTQRGKKYKEITLFKRQTYFLFKVPLLCLPSSKVFVVPCDHICKGPIGIALTLSIVWFVGSFTLSFLTVCVCVCHCRSSKKKCVNAFESLCPEEMDPKVRL